MGNKENEKALSHLERLRKVHTEHPEISYLYGVALSRTGPTKNGVPFIQQAVQSAPHRTDWMKETAKMLLERGEYLEDAHVLAERAYFISRHRDADAKVLIQEIRTMLDREEK